MSLLELTVYGWKVVEGKLECDWDSEENLAAVRKCVMLLFKGCSCSSVSACSTRRCSCVKKGSKCGPGCNCKNCGNVTANTDPGTQQQFTSSSVDLELDEIEQAELRNECGEAYVNDDSGDEEEVLYDEGEEEEEGEED